MEWGSGIALAAALLVVAAVLLPGSAAGGMGSTDQVGDLESDLVIIQADVEADGTATLQIQHAIALTDENVTAAFTELAADIEENESAYLDRFGARMNDTVAAAERTTDREMAVGNLSVRTNRTSLPDEYGLVTYTANWTNFGVVEDDRLRMGDALAGLFIDGNTRFVISWPEEYDLRSVSPEPTDDSPTQVVWEGPREFQADQPSVVVGSGTGGTETTVGPTTTETPATDGPPWGILGIALAVAVAAAVWYLRDGRRPWGPSSTSPSSDAADQQTADTPAGPPSELLSNEERVQQYLESVGGRAKQQEVVEALDWTEAKTSQVLSEMESQGTVEKFRIGRENVVKLPDAGDELE